MGTVLFRSADPDAAVWDWLRNGAPMGLARSLVPGTHFPAANEDPTITLAELDDRAPFGQNRPSFNATHDGVEDSRPPAWDLLEEQVNNGFALLFPDATAASVYLGGVCHPAPLGNVVRSRRTAH